MHVSALNPESFEIEVDGLPATLEDIFPDFTDLDRIGVVVRSPYGGLGGSYLITRAIVEFYRLRRDVGEVYPDNYIFAVGRPQGDHSMLDVWPEHHFVQVPNDAELILQSINDRGITRLLIEATARATPNLTNATSRSAHGRVASTLVFDPSGKVDGGNISIRADHTVERESGLQLDPVRIVAKSEGYDDFLAYYAAHRNDVDAEETELLRAAREHTIINGRRTETFRSVDMDEALAMLQS